jgi:serine/threonine protein kinase
MSAGSESARPDPAVGNRARTAIGWASGSPSETPAPGPAPEAEREGYETGSRLGASPGEVYEATHARLPGRFAIKFLPRARGAETRAIEDFQAEAEQVSVLRHPNIVEVLELGVMPDGTPILVMEHLAGRTLEEMLVNRGAMSLGEALPIIRGIATGLEAAHNVGVVHREVRPDNVFVATITGYEQGFVKLLDFAVSRLNAGPTPGSNVNATAARYLAPEQARGHLSEVDARTDQYALAAIAYRLLSGTDAYAGNDVISVLYRVLNEAPRPLTALARVDTAVDAVIRKAMSRDKRLRFDSVFVFAKALEDAASGGTASRSFSRPMVVSRDRIPCRWARPRGPARSRRERREWAGAGAPWRRPRGPIPCRSLRHRGRIPCKGAHPVAPARSPWRRRRGPIRCRWRRRHRSGFHSRSAACPSATP